MTTRLPSDDCHPRVSLSGIPLLNHWIREIPAEKTGGNDSGRKFNLGDLSSHKKI